MDVRQLCVLLVTMDVWSIVKIWWLVTWGFDCKSQIQIFESVVMKYDKLMDALCDVYPWGLIFFPFPITVKDIPPHSNLQAKIVFLGRPSCRFAKKHKSRLELNFFINSGKINFPHSLHLGTFSFRMKKWVPCQHPVDSQLYPVFWMEGSIDCQLQ